MTAQLFGQEPDGYAGLFDENQSFSGLLDEVRIWSYARSPTQIASAYNISLTGLPASARAGLALYYDFDDRSETTGPLGFVLDLSGNGNTGALGYLPNSKQWMTYASGTKSDRFPTRPVVCEHCKSTRSRLNPHLYALLFSADHRLSTPLPRLQERVPSKCG
jgi:hypothetical protein